ncbi:MAG: flagellar hook-associated protein FlgL [Cycloclasticus sp.]|nr:flagellar hook-associated protein FlgL [Cycloclasticus sp.]
MINRLSTSLAQQLGINSILLQQNEVNNTQLQISSGKRILAPSDDPAGSVRLLDLGESLSRLNKFQSNIDFAESRLSLSDSTLQSVTNSLQRVRELAVQGFNDTNSASDKESIAIEIFARVDELVSLANSRDGNGDYLYAGFKSQTEPFSGSSQTGVFAFNGDQGERYLNIGENRTITDGNSGAEIFFDLKNKDGQAESIFATVYDLAYDLSTDRPAAEEALLTFSAVPADGETLTVNGIIYEFDTAGDGVAGTNVDIDSTGTLDDAVTKLRAAINTGSTVTAGGASNQLLLTSTTEGEDTLSFTDGTAGDITVTQAISIPLYDHLDQLDTALGRILDVRSQVGARLNVLDSQKDANASFILNVHSTKSQIEDLDIAEAISRFNLQLVSLQAAQQAFVKVQGLSLFNHL